MGGPEILSAAPAGAAEGDLIDQNVWGAIRTLWEKGRSRKAIARELDLDIKTVRKWLRRSWDQQRRRRGRRLKGKTRLYQANRNDGPEMLRAGRGFAPFTHTRGCRPWTRKHEGATPQI